MERDCDKEKPKHQTWITYAECRENLLRIGEAKRRWIATVAPSKAVLTPNDLIPWLGSMPQRPGGGENSVLEAGTPPVCSVGTHNER